MNNQTKLPKQIKAEGYSSTTDENGMPVMWISSCQDHREQQIRKVIIDRYNNYPGVVTALWVVSIISVVSLYALLYF